MLPVSHPGRLLRRELDARGLSASRLARELGVSSGRVIGYSERSPFDHGRYGGSSRPSISATVHSFWTGLQSQYDIARVERERGAEIAGHVRPADAA